MNSNSTMRTATDRFIYQTDAPLIFKHVPNRHSVMTRRPINGSERVAQRINAVGFSGNDFHPVDGSNRVVISGDSFIHALYCTRQETFRLQHAEELASHAGNVYWNPHGQRRPAQVIADHVLAHGLLSGGQRHGSAKAREVQSTGV